MMSLLPLFRWFQATGIGVAIRSSTYWFPAIEVVHLLGLVFLLGPVLVVDLRLLGFGMQRQTTSSVAKAAAPLIRIGIGAMVLTGTLLFLAEALKCYENPAFWFKMYFLAGALAFHSTIYRWVTSSDSLNPFAKRLTAILSLMLWFGVAVGGRLIAFL
jgi:hypothetical protein